MLEFNATFLIALISFVIFIVIMNIIFYKPILGIIEERKKFIDDNYSEADNSRQSANKLIEEKENKIKDATAKAKQLINDEVTKANKNAESELNQSKDKAQKQLKLAKENLKTEKDKISETLKHNIKEIAESISSKLLDDKISIENIDYENIDKALK